MATGTRPTTVIRHIATAGGRVRAWSRSESDRLGIEAMASHLDRGLIRGTDRISTLPGHAALMTAEEQDLLVTVFLDERDGPLPLVTFGIATRVSPNAQRLWEIVGGIGSQPSAPWCAVKEEPYAAGHHVALPHLVDYERCLAWAWLDRVGA